jgi:hypothetical protein
MPSTRLFLCIGSLLAGCGLFRGDGKSANQSAPESTGAKPAIVVDMPWETTKARDDTAAPVLTVIVIDNGDDGVAVPYLYGYPLYAEGDAQRGIMKLRHDNWEGSNREHVPAEDGVTRIRETLP